MIADSLSASPVLITHPALLDNEAETLCALLREGAPIIHIRKPEATSAQLEGLLSSLQSLQADMSRLTIHYDEPLAHKYALGGVHLRGGAILAGEGGGLRRSCSAHDWDEAARYAAAADYVFLSPVFDSISKPGYRGKINPCEARDRLRRHEGRIVALGGIAPDNIALARAAGFDSAAALGAVWSVRDGALDTAATLRSFRVLRRKWLAAGGRLQFISDGNLSVAEAFLRGGGRWVQLRMKDTPEAMVVARGREMLALCRCNGALLIVNDAPQTAALIGADGVHLGQGDMSPAQAREIVGNRAIIGSTANTLAQIASRSDGQTDYIGLGPFRYTTTKKNLAPLLGLEGYRSILEGMQGQRIPLPVVAIGGITPDDVPALMETGIAGIALSGAIAGAEDVARTTAVFLGRITAKDSGLK